MATDDQLLAEARERPRMAVVAGVGAAVTVLSPIFGALLLRHQPSNVPAQLLYGYHHQLGRVLSTGLLVVGFLVVGVVLDFLLRATYARNPGLSRALRPLPLGACVAIAGLTVASQVVAEIGAAHFATHGSQTYDEARKAADSGALGYLGILSLLVYVGAVVVVSINALRVGLLTRMLAYVGIGAAVLLVLQPTAIVLLQTYWLGALAVLFLGRWPSGTPRAWVTGAAEPWPSAAEMREQRVRSAEARRGGKPSRSAEQPIEGRVTTTSAPSPATSKRKRKRRR